MRGFTLLELLIVMTILGILVSIAYPNYNTYLIKTRRVDGQTALLHVASQLEQYAVNNHGYQDATLNNLKIPNLSQQKYYQVTIIRADQSQYVIAAIPLNSQKSDKECGTLAMDSQGEKGQLQNNQVFINKNCW